MGRVGPGADNFERESRFAGGCAAILNVRPEIAITGKPLTRTALTPFSCEEVVIRYGERGDWSADELVVPKLPVEAMNDEQGPSGSGKSKKRDNEVQDYRQPEEPIEQDPEKAETDDDKAAVCGASSLDFKLLDEDETETVARTIEPAEVETAPQEPPPALMNTAQNLP